MRVALRLRLRPLRLRRAPRWCAIAGSTSRAWPRVLPIRLRLVGGRRTRGDARGRRRPRLRLSRLWNGNARLTHRLLGRRGRSRHGRWCSSLRRCNRRLRRRALSGLDARRRIALRHWNGGRIAAHLRLRHRRRRWLRHLRLRRGLRPRGRLRWGSVGSRLCRITRRHRCSRRVARFPIATNGRAIDRRIRAKRHRLGWRARWPRYRRRRHSLRGAVGPTARLETERRVAACSHRRWLRADGLRLGLLCRHHHNTRRCHNDHRQGNAQLHTLRDTFSHDVTVRRFRSPCWRSGPGLGRSSLRARCGLQWRVWRRRARHLPATTPRCRQCP
jgi:hypothetical protein